MWSAADWIKDRDNKPSNFTFSRSTTSYLTLLPAVDEVGIFIKYNAFMLRGFNFLMHALQLNKLAVSDWRKFWLHTWRVPGPFEAAGQSEFLTV